MPVFIFGEFVCVHVCVCDNPQKCHVVPFFKVILTYDCSYIVLQKSKEKLCRRTRSCFYYSIRKHLLWPQLPKCYPNQKKFSFSSLVDLYYKKLCSIVFWILLKFYLNICGNLFSILFSKYLHNILDFVSLCVKPQIYSTWLLIFALNKQ